MPESANEKNVTHGIIFGKSVDLAESFEAHAAVECDRGSSISHLHNRYSPHYSRIYVM